MYESFKNGMHVVRRSEREWAGLSTDLVIEQELMRSLKTSGGLTRGSGMSEYQRNIWLLSRPACGHINSVMQSLTGIHHKSGEQIKDLTHARKERDFLDKSIIKEFLVERNPFEIHSQVVNISTGMHAGPEVNVECAKQIGIDIIKKMRDTNPDTFSFRRKDQAVTLASKNGVQIKDYTFRLIPI